MAITKSESNRRYREKTKERYKEYQREYRLKWISVPENRERHNTATKEWRQRHPVEARLYSKAHKLKTRGAKITKEEISNWFTKLCGICKCKIEGEFHIDHIIPLSRGGKHEIANLQLAHPFCNRSKFNKLPNELNYINIELQRDVRSLA